MSAYSVTDAHLAALVYSGAHTAHFSHGGSGLSIYWLDARGVNQRLSMWDPESLQSAAQALRDANNESVDHRYPDGGMSVPEPVVWPERVALLSPVQILKAAGCLEYQSCEHPGYGDSPAYALLQSIRGYATHAIPGYDDAPWDIPNEPTLQPDGMLHVNP